MGSHHPIEVEIQWRCSHCGKPHGQSVAVCMPNGNGNSSPVEPKMVGAGSLICQYCGQLGPIQIGCAVVLGLSVMAASDGALHAPRPAEQDQEADRWADHVRYPSRN